MVREPFLLVPKKSSKTSYGAALMLIAAAVEWRMGVDAERKSLEGVARPLSITDPV